jgi:L-2-hydroxyglutarate oxidase LhgO
LSLVGTKYTNSYDIWVYPSQQPKAPSKGITITRELDKKAQNDLEKGKTVLVYAKPNKLKKSVAMAFQSGFWSPMFRKPGKLDPKGREVAGTQGILCDPKHPIFKDFPTEFHSNWQWWHLVKNSRAMILDDTPQTYRPMVQVIDGIDRNHKLGLIMEAKVGKGKLMVCSIDIPSLQEHPEAQQLELSLLKYMQSKSFAPKNTLHIEALKSIV